MIENLTIVDNPDAKIYLYGDPTSSEDYDITSDRVPTPNTTNGLGDKEAMDNSGLYKNYCKVSLPTEVIFVNMPPEQKANFEISKDKFLSEAGITVQFMTSTEYENYKNSNN